MMKKWMFICSLAIFVSTHVVSQEAAIGAKIGITSGLSLKFPVNGASRQKIEMIFGSSWGGLEFKSLYEVYAEAFDVPGLDWYYGAGMHLGFWRRYRNSPWERHHEKFMGLGIDGVLGMAYRIEDIPIEVSLDLIPTFNVIGYSVFWMDGGLGIRYVF